MPNQDGTGPVNSNAKVPRRKGTGGVCKCTCPECGHKEPHKRGYPCSSVVCPKCGSKMKGDNCL